MASQQIKRTFKIKATLTAGQVDIELVSITKVKPFILKITTGNSHRTTASLHVKNGSGYGCGIVCDSAMHDRLGITIRNGPVKREMGQRHTLVSSERYGYSEVKHNRCVDGIYALRDALDKKFKNAPIDYSFGIEDKRNQYNKKPPIGLSYMNQSYLDVKALIPGTKAEDFEPIVDQIKATCGQNIVLHIHDTHVLVKITKENEHDIYTLTQNLCHFNTVWLIPWFDAEAQTLVLKKCSLGFKLIEHKTNKRSLVNERFSIETQLTHYGIGSSEDVYFNYRPSSYTFKYSEDSFTNNTVGAYFAMTSSKFFLNLPMYLNRHLNFKVPYEQKAYLTSTEAFVTRTDFASCLQVLKQAANMFSKTVGILPENRYDVSFEIGDTKYTTKELQGLETSRAKATFEIYKFESESLDTQIKTKGSFIIPKIAKILYDKLEPITLSYSDKHGVIKDFVVNLKSKDRKLTEDGIELNPQIGIPCIFDFKCKLKNAKAINAVLAIAYNELSVMFLGMIDVQINTPISMELPPTKRCTAFDYHFYAGAEFETGIPNTNVALTGSRDMEDGNVYGSCSDGGGVELQTVVVKNPTVFSWLGKFDSLCKGIRKNTAWGPYKGSSTHIHMSINPAPKLPVAHGEKQKEVNPTYYGDALLRRTLIGSNWWGLLMKYTQALAFFDTFNPSSRRQTGYGKHFVLRKRGDKGYLLNPDNRFDAYWGQTYNELYCSTGRDCLLRTATNNRGILTDIHWEWRGTDACPSALFTGRKVERLQGIARMAIQAALDGIQIPMWDEFLKKDVADMGNVSSAFDITDVLCREKGKEAAEELKPFITKEAYRGLKAWATHVEIVRDDVGTKAWFEEMEAILIQKMGVSNFLTNEELREQFQKSGNSFVPVNYESDKGKLLKKKKLYGRVIPEEYLTSKRGGSYDTRTVPRVKKKEMYCFKCGTSNAVITLKGLGLCPTCLREEPKKAADAKHGAEPYVPRTNITKELQATINELVTESLRIGEPTDG